MFAFSLWRMSWLDQEAFAAVKLCRLSGESLASCAQLSAQSSTNKRAVFSGAALAVSALRHFQRQS